MINDWLLHTEVKPSPYGLFGVIDVSEKKAADSDVVNYLSTEILTAYRNLDELKFRYVSRFGIRIHMWLVYPNIAGNLVTNGILLRRSANQRFTAADMQ